MINLGIRWRRKFIFTPRLLYPRVRTFRYPLTRRLGGPQSRSGQFGCLRTVIPFCTGVQPRFVSHPACSLLTVLTATSQVLQKRDYARTHGNLVCMVEARIQGTLIDEWRRSLVVGHLSARDSMKGTLRENSFIGEPERWGFWEICKMPCKRATLFIGALMGNLEGVRLPGLFREKKSITGFFSWIRRPLRF